jgi:hypothetical protein
MNARQMPTHSFAKAGVQIITNREQQSTNTTKFEKKGFNRLGLHEALRP